jgi:hypothetical protein
MEVIMSRGEASGYFLERSDAPIIMGMIERGDRDHDIAAWFGVNQGRIAEVKDGSKFGFIAAAPAQELPPKGPTIARSRKTRALSSLPSLKAANACCISSLNRRPLIPRAG